MHRVMDQVMQRVRDAKADSDLSYFFSLLLAGEALFKTVTLGMIAALEDDKDRNRYRLEHALARADGLGEWGRALEDALSGPASQYLLVDARTEQAELARVCSAGDWQYESVASLKAALKALNIEAEDLPAKTDLRRWFRLFVTLRNKTRGHGAMQPEKVGLGAEDLEASIKHIYANLSLLRRPWADLYRNYSGKYRILSITDNTSSFDGLRKESQHALRNGVYIHFQSYRRVPLLSAGPELSDFYFANGGLGAKRFEMLSYLTDDKIDGDAGDYAAPPGTLPASETEGLGELRPCGHTFSNVPDALGDYVPRPALEADLRRLLLDDRRPVVTLVGRGGIGKTSLSLKVIHDLYDTGQYQAVVWLSARDVDLKLTGPKPVRPNVLSPDDMGRLYARLVLSADQLKAKGFSARAFFEGQLQKNEIGPCLYVFDNFETTQNPIDMFNWIDTFIRSPNKVLITTRLRDFKGDYPLEVRGMEDAESRELVNRTSVSLGITETINRAFVDEIVQTAEGHPYVMKILLGELATTGRVAKLAKVIAGNDELLTALFERTYASLKPCAQRAFLTMCAWSSSVPRIALEAVLMRSTAERMEVESGVEALVQYSMAELHTAPTDQQVFIRLPLVASAFGKKKLNVSPLRASIMSDVELLQMLGPSRSDDIHLGLANRLEKFIFNIARRVDQGQSFDDYASIVEMICRAYAPGWLMLARWHLSTGTPEDCERAKDELTRYLEQQPDEVSAAEAWRMLGHACLRLHDKLGEIHAFIERAQLALVTFYDVSSTANRLNALLRDQGLDVDQEEKRNLAQRLLVVLERRRNEATANDLSRMAWLALHTDQQLKAAEFVSAGLQLEPGNPHCVGLKERLGV
jgi:GTPase SAR1 family protein